MNRQAGIARVNILESKIPEGLIYQNDSFNYSNKGSSLSTYGNLEAIYCLIVTLGFLIEWPAGRNDFGLNFNIAKRINKSLLIAPHDASILMRIPGLRL